MIELRPNKIPEFFPDDEFFFWAIEDKKLEGDLPTLRHLKEHVYSMLSQFRTVVQAGGAMGIWPKYMSRKFQTVYTFEPTPASFRACVANNQAELNVFAFNCGLGACADHVTIGSPDSPTNYGAFHVQPKPGSIPIMSLDDFEFDNVDLLMLDIEGYELYALLGAKETIERCKPVIVLEDKLACTRLFGYKPGDCGKWLAENCDYRTWKRFHGGRDVIIAHESHEIFASHSNR